MDSIIIRKLQIAEIEILDFVVDICNQHKLRYYLLYGTLLGAVRHKGFIPWDDDVDIGLPRKDYEKLCMILNKQCEISGSKYYFQNPCLDSTFKRIYSKVMKRGTLFLEDDEVDASFEQGIFIDIFPLDKAKHRRGIQKVFKFLIYRILERINENNTNQYFKMINWMSRFYEQSDHGYYINYGSPYSIEKDIYKLEWFAEGRNVYFENKTYRGPVNAEAFLEQIYGKDYMQLPPLEKRVCHNPKIISFGESMD